MIDKNGLSDPYFKIFFNDTLKLTSQVIKKPLNPVWKEAAHNVYDVNGMLMIEIWDKDLLRDDFMGYVEINITKSTPESEWYELKARKSPMSGSILVRLNRHDEEYTVSEDRS